MNNNQLINSTIDRCLLIKQLPNTMWKKGAVKNDTLSNYEIYMRELINNSEYFRNKANGQLYAEPQREDHGEPDAYSDSYQIDFKLLLASSMGNAQNNTDFQIEMTDCYSYITKACKAYKEKDKEKRYASNLLPILRPYTYQDLIDEKYPKENNIIRKDIKNMINDLNKQKNLLLIIPSIFSIAEPLTSEDKLLILKNALQLDAYKLIEYRKHILPQLDTYICTILEESFVVLGDDGSKLEIIEVIDANECPTYLHLKSLHFCI